MNRSIEQQVFIDEYNLVEKPAIDLFKKLNYDYIYGKTLKKEPQQFFLTDILRAKIKELNPWLTDTNLNKIIREITLIQATSNIEANKTFYYKLVNYTSIKQDKGYGKKSQTVKMMVSIQ